MLVIQPSFVSRVDIFGTYHLDRPTKVESELSEFAQEVDVFFVEAPHEPTTNRDELLILLRNPVMSIAGLLLDLLWGTLGFLLTRRFGPVDGTVTDRVATEQGIEIAPVDMNLIQRASDVSLLISVVSWVMFIMSLIIIASGILFTSLGVLSWGIVIGLLPLLPFVFSTLDERDDIMAQNIEDTLSSCGNVEQGCLVVGHKHMNGIVEALEDKDVQVGEQHKSKLFRRRE